ncbi:MAG: tRNA (adenosine(37)-N6)-threonylcarbamoyltransferase complex ATPase subunit type 1 TsaE [Bryobacterales bacterium]|nr:tRNA (adenosine(37)-N6)-threonylcarbamoyltransferase complex ATPase subunit type 1 TsaE [Bryobacterales bacterium]
MHAYKTNSAEETMALGERLAASLPRRGVVLLSGGLGAGKTTLAKGIAAGLGAAKADEVSSPTFTLIHEYGEPVSLYHIDLYRIEEPRELATLELEDLMDRDALVLIEWGERFAHLMPKPRHEVRIERSGESGRTVEVREIS